MLVELGVVEQRYQAVLEVLAGAAVTDDVASPLVGPPAVRSAGGSCLTGQTRLGDLPPLDGDFDFLMRRP